MKYLGSLERPKIESFELIRAWDILQSTLQRAQALLVLRDVSRIMRKSSPRICDLPKEPPAAAAAPRGKEGGRLHTAETGDITTVQKVLQRLHEERREGEREGG